MPKYHLLVMQMSKFQAWIESYLLIAGLCFVTNLFTKLTISLCGNMFTHLKFR